MIDKYIIKRCLDLSRLGSGNVSPNPLVGAVITFDNKIIGEGYHRKYGDAHAEVNAIHAVSDKSLLAKSTIYVSLEPCFHFGKTPPCVDLILRYKIPKVVICCTDPNPKVAGQSILKLRQNGVEVVCNVLEEQGKHVNSDFFKNNRLHRPYIILKYAKSADGFIAQKNRQIWISNAIAKRLTHKWRSETDAILVGTNTALLDNPKLTNRLFYGKNPIRIVLDRYNRLPDELHLFDGSSPTWIISENDVKISNKRHGVTYIKNAFDQNFIPQLLKSLFDRNIKSLIVEGGNMLLSSFIALNMWDESRIYTSEKSLNNGVLGPQLLNAKLSSRQYLKGDMLEIFYLSKT